jgi:CheY-like chemotaxis protein
LTVTAPTRFGEGYIFGAFLRDISERRERDELLRTAKESAEAATRAKSEFLANMSHELRTPLNGVLGYAQLLQRDRGITPRQREALDAITKSGSHLLDVINEILDLSKIEAGRIDSEATATDLVQMAADVRQLMGEAAARKGLALRTSLAADVPRAACLDGRHLRQVLVNLVGNAIKFTPEGEVRLNVVRGGDQRLMFEVVDTGIGIEPEALSTIFDAFTQTTTGAAAGGTGLGLTISRNLVRMMGGELAVESVRGSGSRFFFSLPLVNPVAGCAMLAGGSEPPLDAELASGQTLTALVADDSTLNRRLLSDLLESAGVTVFAASGGEEAIRMAREHRPDVVLMDLRMPDLDGLEATRRLRSDPATEHMPVIAVTASALGDAPQAALDAGCAGFIPKPVRAQTLFASLEHTLQVTFVARPLMPAAAEPELAPAVRAAMALRLKHAAGVGDVGAVEAIIAELTAEQKATRFGGRIQQLARTFDFDAMLTLADELTPEETHAGA